MSPPPRRQPTPIVLLVSAPSGAGKTTVCEALLAVAPELARAITCTTRAPRAGEADGRDYYFLDSAEFARRIEAGAFLEHAVVYGNRYGTLRSEVHRWLDAGRDVLLNIDVQGAANVRAHARTDAAIQAALVTVFLVTPSRTELEARLRRRGTESPAELTRRLDTARRELEQARHFDYLLVSGTPEQDRQRLLAIYQAEKLRTARTPLPEF